MHDVAPVQLNRPVSIQIEKHFFHLYTLNTLIKQAVDTTPV